MKKTIKYLSLLMIVLFIATGCGSKKGPKETLKEAFDNMSKVESLSAKMNVDMSIGAQGMSIDMDMSANMKVDKNKNMYIGMDMAFFGVNESMESYIINKDGYSYTYTKDGADTPWHYTKAESSATDEEKDLSESWEDIYDAVVEVKEEKSDRDGYTKLVLTIGKDKMKKLMEENMTAEELGEMPFDTDVTFNLYVKDGYISIIEFDASDLMETAMANGEAEVEGMTAKAKLTIEFSDFNKVTINLPKEVEESAMTEEEYEEYSLENESDYDLDVNSNSVGA